MGGNSGGGGKAGRGGGMSGGNSNDVDAFIDKLMAERRAQEVKVAKPTRYELLRGGSSVRDDDNAGGRRDMTSDFARRMKKERDRSY